MMLPSPDKQFSLQSDGQIFFQVDTSNPLPGLVIGHVEKGESLLKPKAVLSDSEIFEGQDKELIAKKLQDWLNISIHLALEPLFRLTAGDDHTSASRAIAELLFEDLGIRSRDSLQSEISKLDEEGRKVLRARKVRMGPIIVYMPELNKPAAIRLRALLLTLWLGNPLPAEIPPDGMVSLSVVDKNMDAGFLSKIGYPVYGPRAIRVDMLDRVICSIYDSADKGIFKADHKMAEWMGANIPDLYAILEAMGHIKIHDPAEKINKNEEQDHAASVIEENVSSTNSEVADGDLIEKKVHAKPELATFRLKRAIKHVEKEKLKKPVRQNSKNDSGRPEKGTEKNNSKNRAKNRADRNEGERIYSAKAAIEDNPFAVLQNLKLNHEK